MADWVAAIAAVIMIVIVVGGGLVKWLSKVAADLADHKTYVAENYAPKDDKVATDLAEHKTHVAENYATKDDVKELGDRMERNMDSGFERIYNLLKGNNAA